MKGISPLVAAVLLIAFTVAIGGIISVWLTTFSKTATQQVQAATEYQIRCAVNRLSLKVFEDANKIFVTNEGPENVTLSSILLSDGSYANFNATVTLTKGESKMIEVNKTDIIDTALDLGGKSYVTVKGLCLGAVPIEETCKNTQDCWS